MCRIVVGLYVVCGFVLLFLTLSIYTLCNVTVDKGFESDGIILLSEGEGHLAKLLLSDIPKRMETAKSLVTLDKDCIGLTVI